MMIMQKATYRELADKVDEFNRKFNDIILFCKKSSKETWGINSEKIIKILEDER